MDINLQHGVSLGNKLLEIIIDSDSDTYPVEDDIMLKVAIQEFKESNPHLCIEHEELRGPDSSGYENYAILHVREIEWYTESVKKNITVIFNGIEYYLFAIRGYQTPEPVVMLIDKKTKVSHTFPIGLFNNKWKENK